MEEYAEMISEHDNLTSRLWAIPKSEISCNALLEDVRHAHLPPRVPHYGVVLVVAPPSQSHTAERLMAAPHRAHGCTDDARN